MMFLPSAERWSFKDDSLLPFSTVTAVRWSKVDGAKSFGPVFTVNAVR